MAQIANADPTKCTYKHKGRLIKKKKTSQAGCVGSQLGLPHFRNPKLARNAFITSCNTIPKQKRRKQTRKKTTLSTASRKKLEVTKQNKKLFAYLIRYVGEDAETLWFI